MRNVIKLRKETFTKVSASFLICSLWKFNENLGKSIDKSTKVCSRFCLRKIGLVIRGKSQIWLQGELHINNAKRIKDSLDICIDKISESKQLYCVNPDRDFTRNKKLPFSEVLKTILCFTSKSLNSEMIEFFDFNRVWILNCVNAFSHQISQH